MDAREEAKKVKEPPPVPIKTYQWEDIRRARRRGGYPWTYLDKRPFDDTNLDDFKVYRMDKLRKTKSSVEMDTNGVTIEEITNGSDDKVPNADENKENILVESTSSVDVSVSQYLDKDDAMDSSPGPSKSPEKGKTETMRSQRAKSEEPGRKRKHSIESSYSRISKYSLSKMGFIKKLKETKDKIKLPKFSFSKSESKLNKKPQKDEEAPVKVVTASKKDKIEPKKVQGPLYIHIPLKPPPGETDEFSYLEFEEQKTTKDKVGTTIPEEPTVETPTENPTGVQLIILTAPSDDEILDTPAVPETPNESDKALFELKKLEELKDLAKNVVDRFSPETKRKVIQPVKEEEEAEEEPLPKPASEAKVEVKPETEVEAAKAEVKQDAMEQIEPVVVDKPAVPEEKVTKKKKKVKKEKSKDKTKEADVEQEKVIKQEEEKVIKQEEEKVIKQEEEKIIETQKTDDEKLKEQETQHEVKPEPKLFVDEEDGLKSEEIIKALIEQDMEELENAKMDELLQEIDEAKESPRLKKKVSFKRRSKDDSDGIYEDVQVSSEPAKKDREEVPRATPSPTPNLLIDEGRTKMHADRVKGMTIAEEYEYWCRVNAHDYEPVNPPNDENFFRPIGDDGTPKKPSTPVTDSDIEFLAARAADIELRTTGVITITNKEEPSEALFVPLESALKVDAQSTKSDGKDDGHGKKIQEAIQKQASNLKRQASVISKKASDQAEKIQTRVKSIKRPKIKMPSKPEFKKPTMPKIKKPHLPKLHIEKPKMPNMKISEKMKNISLSLPRKGRRSSTRRPTSTESTAGDSEKRTTVFDFSTYPRIFKKKKRHDDGDDVHTPRTGTDTTPVSERTTLPRFKFTSRWKGKFTEKKTPPSSTTVDTVNSLRSKDSERSETQGSVRIPLHSEGSMDRDSLDLRSKEEREQEYREDSVERRMRLASTRYKDEIEMDDAYLMENQEIHRASSMNAKFNERWNHGTFHEKASEEVEPPVEEKPTSILKKKIENIHSGSSDDIHRRGVLEEINSDEFFLRQKGISQDNIEVGAYLSSEIREAFRTPSNALSQLETSAQPEAPKRRPLKKPKRKKTPHVSQEGIQFDQESIHTEPDEYPKYNDDFENFTQPERPKRRSKKKQQDLDMTSIEDQILAHDEYLKQQQEDYMYENEKMQGIEQPNISISDAYQAEHNYPDDMPAPPPRKHKSLRSLNAMSEIDSITGEFNGYKEIHTDLNQYEHEYQIPTPDHPPKRPFRTRSRTRSHSRGSALPDEETAAKSILSTSQQSLTCNEEPCKKVLCDYMGYSVIDKGQIRDPPLPPCRRRSLKSEGAEEEHFFTVPRSSSHAQPVRPLRNYSTLGPSRPPRKQSVPNMTDEEKHTNGAYIEIEDDEHTKLLQSGDVIKKMRDRPLPAPPRPPRKGRDRSRGSRKSNKSLECEPEDEFQDAIPDEFEVSVQTEPLPAGFECEELVRDVDDRVITPTVDKYSSVRKPRSLQEFEHQETITHGSLVVQPFRSHEKIPEGPIEVYSRSTERIVTVKKEAESEKDLDYDETSEIPEEFKRLKSPPQVVERIIEKHIPIQLEVPEEVDTLRAHKLQVTDLDVDRLAVHELHANKIKVGEIDSSAINVQEINSNSGNLVVSGIELPASFFQQLVDKLQEQAEQVARPLQPLEHPRSPTPTAKVVETKESETNTETELRTRTERMHDTIPIITQAHEMPTLSTEPATFREEIGQTIDAVITEAEDVVKSLTEEDEEFGQKKTPSEKRSVDVDSVTPQRPPRAPKAEQGDAPPIPPLPQTEESEPTPPPRPPQPSYSQPPASFYALRSPPAFKDIDIDDDIPHAPRRRRHHHQHHYHPKTLESSSEDLAPIKRRHRTPEPSIPELTGQLTRACLSVTERSLKRLIQQTTEYVLGHMDGKHDVNVGVVILLVFIALLFLIIGWNGEERQVHHHHWEYFNPPRDI